MKESLYHLDISVIFRETFNSEQDTRKNGGTPTDVIYGNGVGTFNGSSSKTVFPNLTTGTYSVRIRLKDLTPSGTQFIVDFNVFDPSFGYIYLTNTTVSPTIGGTSYVDGSPSTTVVSGSNEIVVSGLSMVNDGVKSMTIGSRGSGAQNFLNSDIDLLEIYDRTLTANEVALLYENALYKEPVLENEVLSIDARNGGIIDKWGNTLTNTSVSIVDDGGIKSMRFDGADSKLDCGSELAGSGDVTIISWIKPFSRGESGFSRIVDNNKLICFMTTNNRISTSSDGGVTQVNSSNDSIVFLEYSCVIITRTSAGVVNFYVNGVLSGSANQDSGTPAAGTTNFLIGNDNTQVRTFDGNIPITKLVSSILTTKQIEQYYNSTKRYFQ